MAGIGNVWRWEARLSPWRPLEDVSDSELLAVLDAAHRLMLDSVTGTRHPRRAYRRAARGCPRCGGTIRSRPQGDAARIAYRCPSCQPSALDTE